MLKLCTCSWAVVLPTKTFQEYELVIYESPKVCGVGNLIVFSDFFPLNDAICGGFTKFCRFV
jgi:hypothetical protein